MPSAYSLSVPRDISGWTNVIWQFHQSTSVDIIAVDVVSLRERQMAVYARSGSPPTNHRWNTYLIQYRKLRTICRYVLVYTTRILTHYKYQSDFNFRRSYFSWLRQIGNVIWFASKTPHTYQSSVSILQIWHINSTHLKNHVVCRE